jgi:hypothetical protein
MNGRRAHVAAVLAGILGTAQILALTRHGPGIAPDSVDYLAGAMSLAEGRGYTDVATGDPLFHWPPLFSAAMAAIHRLTGVPVVEAGRWLNAVVFGALVAAALLLLWEQTGSVIVTAVGALLVMTAAPLTGGAAALLSEPLFCLLVLGCALALRHSLESGNLPWAAGVLAGLAALQRYVGGFLIPCGALLLLSPLGRGAWRERIARAALFTAIGIAPVLAWGWRNSEVLGSFSGPRHPSTQGWLEVSLPVVKVLSRWVTPERVPLGARAAILALAVAAAALAWRRRWQSGAWDRRQRLTLVCCLAVTVAYLGAMVLAALRTAMPAFNDRYLSPVYVLLVVMVASLAAGGKRWVQAALLAWCLFPLSRSAGVTAAMVRDDHNPLEANFNDREWRASATLAWVRETLREAAAGRRVYSNAADAIWFHTGRAALGVPDPGKSTEVCPGRGECYLVWFDRVRWRTYLPTVAELSGRFQVREVRRFGDGTVYALAGENYAEH